MGRGGIDELRDESEEEGGRLGIEDLDDNAFVKRPSRAGRALLRNQERARFPKGADAEPDQIERTAELERSEKLRAGKDDCGDADGSRNDVNDAAEGRARRGCDAGGASTRHRPRSDIQNARTRDGGKDQ